MRESIIYNALNGFHFHIPGYNATDDGLPAGHTGIIFCGIQLWSVAPDGRTFVKESAAPWKDTADCVKEQWRIPGPNSPYLSLTQALANPSFSSELSRLGLLPSQALTVPPPTVAFSVPAQQARPPPRPLAPRPAPASYQEAMQQPQRQQALPRGAGLGTPPRPTTPPPPSRLARDRAVQARYMNKGEKDRSEEGGKRRIRSTERKEKKQVGPGQSDSRDLGEISKSETAVGSRAAFKMEEDDEQESKD